MWLYDRYIGISVFQRCKPNCEQIPPLSLNVEESFKEFLDPVSEADNFKI